MTRFPLYIYCSAHCRLALIMILTYQYIIYTFQALAVADLLISISNLSATILRLPDP